MTPQVPDYIKKIAKTAYPDYKGRKIRYRTDKQTIDTSYNANWSEGSRTEYKFVRTDNGAVLDNPNKNLAPWQHTYDQKEIATLIPGLACVTHSIFMGKDTGLTVYIYNGPEIEGDK